MLCRTCYVQLEGEANLQQERNSVLPASWLFVVILALMGVLPVAASAQNAPPAKAPAGIASKTQHLADVRFLAEHLWTDDQLRQLAEKTREKLRNDQGWQVIKGVSQSAGGRMAKCTNDLDAIFNNPTFLREKYIEVFAELTPPGSVGRLLVFSRITGTGPYAGSNTKPDGERELRAVMMKERWFPEKATFDEKMQELMREIKLVGGIGPSLMPLFFERLTPESCKADATPATRLDVSCSPGVAYQILAVVPPTDGSSKWRVDVYANQLTEHWYVTPETTGKFVKGGQCKFTWGK